MTSSIKLTYYGNEAIGGGFMEEWEDLITFMCLNSLHIVMMNINKEASNMTVSSVNKITLEYFSDGLTKLIAFDDDEETTIYEGYVVFSDQELDQSYICETPEGTLLSVNVLPDEYIKNRDNWTAVSDSEDVFIFSKYTVRELLGLSEPLPQTVDVIDGKAVIPLLATENYSSAVYTIHAEYSGTDTLLSATGEGILTLHSPTPEWGGGRRTD